MKLRELLSRTTWWGKLIGAIFGYLTAGPAGALFGILIGNFFDRGLVEHLSRLQDLHNTESRQEVQNLFFEATFSAMGHIAKADGRVSEQEIDVAKTIMRDMRLKSSQKKAAQHFFNVGKSPAFNLQDLLWRLRDAAADNVALLRLFVDIQYRAAQAGGFSQKKIETMDEVLQALGFAPLQKQHRFYEDTMYGTSGQQQSSEGFYSSSNRYDRTSYTQYGLDKAYALLEVDAAASQQDVKRAYRRLMSKHHPDKLIAQGASKEEIREANEKTQRIRKAYDEICTLKGW